MELYGGTSQFLGESGVLHLWVFGVSFEQARYHPDRHAEMHRHEFAVPTRLAEPRYAEITHLDHPVADYHDRRHEDCVAEGQEATVGPASRREPRRCIGDSSRRVGPISGLPVLRLLPRGEWLASS